VKLSITIRNVTADPRPFGLYGYRPNPLRRIKYAGYVVWDLLANPRELVATLVAPRSIEPGEVVELAREVGPTAHGLEWYVKPEAHRCFEVRLFTLGDLSLIVKPGLLGAPPVE